MEGKQKSLHFVEYDDLINNPEDTMRKIYDFLGEEYFQHDFSKIENIHRERDAEVYGMPDMHDVRESLGRRGIDPRDYLSEATLAKCKDAEFWRNINEGYDAQDFAPDEEEVKTTDEPASLIGA
jgi:sulfotransferase